MVSVSLLWAALTYFRDLNKLGFHSGSYRGLQEELLALLS